MSKVGIPPTRRGGDFETIVCLVLIVATLLFVAVMGSI